MPLLKIRNRKEENSVRNCLEHYKKLPTQMQGLITILWVRDLRCRYEASSIYMLSHLLIADDSIDKSHTFFRSIYRHLKRKSEGEKLSRQDPLLKLEQLDCQATNFISHPIWRVLSSSRLSNAKIDSLVSDLPKDIQASYRDLSTGEFKPNIDKLANQTNLDALCAMLLIILRLNNEGDYFKNSFERSQLFTDSNQILFKLVFRLFVSLYPEKHLGVLTLRCLFRFCRYIENTLTDVKCNLKSRAVIKFCVFNPNCSDKNKHRELFLPSMFVAADTAQCVGYPNLVNLSYQALFFLYLETYQLVIEHSRAQHLEHDFALLVLSVINHSELSEIYSHSYETPQINNKTLKSALKKATTLIQ